MTTPHKVVIVGGGFGGLNAARALRGAPVDLTLVDRRNVHLFQPLLYQVATGGLSPADIASPLRWILRRQRNCRVWLADVKDLDLTGRRVILRNGGAPDVAVVPYDTLVVATGAGNHYFGNDHWASLAPSLKTIEDAVEIRRRTLLAFESAEREPDPDRRREWMTFVVVGGGATGVELAGALSELARDTLRRDFRAIDPAASRIILVEGMDRVLPPFPRRLSDRSARSLGRLGVEVRTDTFVTDVTPTSVVVKAGAQFERIATRTVLWAAGVRGSPLGGIVARATGATLDRAGRVEVGPACSVAGHPNVFVIGDLAGFTGPEGQPLPGVAPVAMQQGRYVARVIRKRLRGAAAPAFTYRDKGMLATIGRAAAVARLGPLEFSGYPAWLLWLFVHLMYLVGFQNRALVLIQWAWHYFTRNRGARIIAQYAQRDTADGPLP